MNYLEIKTICETYKIQNYTINSDGSVDVNGDVDLCSKGLTELPLKFGKVYGSFGCSYNELTSLEGSPNYVSGYFNCHTNKLTSLKGCPKYIVGWFSCAYNYLTSLEFAPNYTESFYCWDNPLPQEILDNPKSYLKRLNRDNLINELLSD